MINIKQDATLPTSTEVIVIGSGFAGLAAAIECHMNGGKVIVLEKMKAIGGNSIISDGGIAAPNTDEQKALGIHDSAAMMFDDMMRSGEGLNDPKLSKIVCEHALDAYQWSKDVLKVKYMHRVDIFGGHQVPRCYSPEPLSGSTIILRLKEKCEELGIPIHLGVYVNSFIMEEDQRVIGVQVDENYRFDPAYVKQFRPLYASKGIIVASGGFAADVQFINKHGSTLETNPQTTNKRSTSAEVLEACMTIQCATDHLDQIQWMPWTTNDESGYGKGGLFGDYIVSSYGILIDQKNGQRFVNELGNRRIVTEAILKTKDVIGIVDSSSVDKAGWDLEAALKKGIIQSHPSFEALAEHYAIPIPNLKQTITEYNAMLINNQVDPYGKVIETWMAPIQNSPYYSMRMNPKTHYSLGGLVTDVDARVLNDQGQIVQGLYAAGEVTGLTHGANRLGSCSVTECLVMGRIAGRNSVKD